MAQRLSTVPFLNQAEGRLLLDVRSPGEFANGHIPGAVSFPLFSDEERSEVGTLYKQDGKEPAFLRGLEFVGPKMAGFVTRARNLSPDGKAFLYCWRGGMRSGSMAWLLEASGLDISLLEGGYKAFRHAVLHPSPLPDKIMVIGGFTGSRKSEILNEMPKLGEAILDLERLANHKGSAFGSLGLPPQPRQEQFENDIFMNLLNHPPGKALWLEDESKAIGKLRIPDTLHAEMRNAMVVFLEKSREERLKHIVESYGKEHLEDLKNSMQRIARRLGGLALKQALEHLDKGEILEAAALSLHYYDKSYGFGLSQREEKRVKKIDCSGMSDLQAAIRLQEEALLFSGS